MGLLDELSGLAGDMKPGNTVQDINVELIDRDPSQPRTKTFDAPELNELAENIKLYGVLEPILVRKVGDRFMIIAGERRWRATKMAQIATIPAIVREDFEEEKKRYLAQVSENTMRKDLSAIELRESIVKMRTYYKMKQAEIAQHYDINDSDVSGILLMADPANAAEAALCGESYLLLQKLMSKKFPADVRALLVARGEPVTFTHVEKLRDLADAGGVVTSENIQVVLDALNANAKLEKVDLLRIVASVESEVAVVAKPTPTAYVEVEAVPADIAEHATSMEEASEDLDGDEEPEYEFGNAQPAESSIPAGDIDDIILTAHAIGYDKDEAVKAVKSEKKSVQAEDIVLFRGKYQPDLKAAPTWSRDGGGDVIDSDFKADAGGQSVRTVTMPATTISEKAARKLIRLLGGDEHIDEHDVLITLSDLINKL